MWSLLKVGVALQRKKLSLTKVNITVRGMSIHSPSRQGILDLFYDRRVSSKMLEF